MDLFTGKESVIKSTEDVRNFIKAELADDSKATLYSVEKKLLSASKDKLSLNPRSKMIMEDFKSFK